MNTSAIQQAIKLYKHPQEMYWLCSPEADLPEGVTDLLRLCSSQKKLKEFVQKIHIEESVFAQVLNDFIVKVLLKDGNSLEKQLGLVTNNDIEKRKLHYQFLMKIFHPDRNPSEDAAQKTSLITQVYKELKSVDKDGSIYIGENIEVSYKNIPPHQFSTTSNTSTSRATNSALQHMSFSKKAFTFVSSVALLAILLLGFDLFYNEKPQLVISDVSSQQNTSNKVNDNFSLTALSDPNGNNVPTTHLEKLLHKLELAYENGDVAQIKPILENTPDLRDQTGAEISAKLVSLFKITNDRKMVLFNFSWNKISNRYQGEGKFISRYMMLGGDHWLTREGKALITAEIDTRNQLKITNLQLKDHTIEQ